MLVLISGASAGIGCDCARVFAENNCDIALGARRVDRLRVLKPELEQLGAKEVYVGRLDVRSSNSVEEFTAAVRSEIGVPDVLINNAGLAKGVDHIADGDESDWQAMVDTNIMGLLRLTRSFLPEMKRANSGHIVNIGSIAGYQTYAGGAVYAGTKHAVRAINDALRMELLGSAIRVTSLDPGMVETEFSRVRLGDADKAEAVYQGLTPLTGRDIAECVWFAVSRPTHVNIDHMVMMPVAQASVYHVHRQKN